MLEVAETDLGREGIESTATIQDEMFRAVKLAVGAGTLSAMTTAGGAGATSRCPLCSCPGQSETMHGRFEVSKVSDVKKKREPRSPRCKEDGQRPQVVY